MLIQEAAWLPAAFPNFWFLLKRDLQALGTGDKSSSTKWKPGMFSSTGREPNNLLSPLFSLLFLHSVMMSWERCIPKDCTWGKTLSPPHLICRSYREDEKLLREVNWGRLGTFHLLRAYLHFSFLYCGVLWKVELLLQQTKGRILVLRLDFSRFLLGESGNPAEIVPSCIHTDL